MKRSGGGIDQSYDFFLTEDRWDATLLFGIGSVRDTPSLFESLGVEEPQSRETVGHFTRWQLRLLKQLGLVFANVPRTQTVRRALESPSKIFDGADVVACGILRVITALEFFQHHFAKSGHRDLLMTRQLTSAVRHKLLRSPHAQRPPHGRLRSHGQLGSYRFVRRISPVKHDCSDCSGGHVPVADASEAPQDWLAKLTQYEFLVA